MNPAVVSITILPVSDSESSILIEAAAKEGLIKQRTAEKAVTRLEESFRQAFPSASE